MIKTKECIINIIYKIKSQRKQRNSVIYQHAILFYRTARIGDFILFLHGATEILNKYSDWKKILICHPCCEELAESLNLWDEIITFDYKQYKKSFRYQKQIEYRVSKLYVEKLFNMEYSRTLYSEILIEHILAKEKYSFDGPCFTTDYIRRKSNEHYTSLLPIAPEVMELKKNAEFAVWIIGKPIETKIYNFPKLADYNLSEKSYYVLSPGASYPEKMWPIDRFVELIDLLWDKYKLLCILSGSENEQFLADRITRKVQRGKVLNKLGKTTLLESFELIRNAKFLIGNDSASVHMAASVKTISFCITGGWDGTRFLPYDVIEEDVLTAPIPIRVQLKCYGCCLNGGVVKARPCGVVAESANKDGRIFECIEAIPVEMVFEKILEQINI